MNASDANPPTSDAGERALLRHALATLAYRAGKVLRDPPPGFERFSAGEGLRTPGSLVGHLGDLLEWGASLAAGEWAWKAASTGEWERDVDRFYAALARLDAALAAEAPLGHPPSLIFQGPVADAFTHVGQLAWLRRQAGAPLRPESFAKAQIRVGQVGREQAPPQREFDGDASERK